MENLAFHSLLRWNTIIPPNLHYVTYTFLFKSLERIYTFWTWGWTWLVVNWTSGHWQFYVYFIFLVGLHLGPLVNPDKAPVGGRTKAGKGKFTVQRLKETGARFIDARWTEAPECQHSDEA